MFERDLREMFALPAVVGQALDTDSGFFVIVPYPAPPAAEKRKPDA